MPVDRWSTEQVLALAPDASSVRNARTVSGPATWEGSGVAGEILWGLCRGSGKTSYQVCVDLSGPAFRCSCPSRKFPCKHALGLLLLWAAGGEGGSGDSPGWVSEWRAARAHRAASRAASEATEPGPSDATAAARRAAQRRTRVAAGMDELRRWLDDQVRQGLAETERAGHRPFETMAARLVDAQAPAAAAAVRRLGHVVGVGPDWADRLLGELGLLRLLTTAHDRLDDLPADLAATVRTRIGFPVSREEVLATTAVRDHWQVLGQTDSVEEKLVTRRTWLLGAGTGRYAVLLGFAPPGQAIPVGAVPGTHLEADLCFRPGTPSVRAVLATRHGTPQSVSSPTGALDVPQALARHTALLAADPWWEATPVLLGDVRFAGDAHVVDPSGAALPLAPGHTEPWWLLAAAGGQPLTLVAELSPAGLRPVAAWSQGRYLSAGPVGSAGGPARVVAGRGRGGVPPALLAAALVGTARRPLTDTTVDVDGRVLTIGGDGDAGTLLEAAAVAVSYRGAGMVASSGCPSPAPAPEEAVPWAGRAASARLRGLLVEGGGPGGAEQRLQLIGEWLCLAETHRRLVPPELLPELLDLGRHHSTLRPLLARVAGRRGRWLAEQRQDWAYLLAQGPACADDQLPADTWERGSPQERTAYLEGLRRVDPEAARRLLAEGFAAEAPEDRARFVRALATGLAAEDEPFLEQGLDDRRKEVREAAAGLLRRRPESALGRRMARRALDCVRLERRPLRGDRLTVRIPEGCDAAMRRDGVDPRPPRGTGQGAWLLEQVVAGTPLTVWTTTWARPPGAIVTLPVTDDWRPVLLRGWVDAAIGQRDVAWATALADVLGHGGAGSPVSPTDPSMARLYELLPAERWARLTVEALTRGPEHAWPLLTARSGSWPETLVTAVVELIGDRTRMQGPSWYGALCRMAGAAMPPHSADRITAVTEQLRRQDRPTGELRHVDELARTLTFRSDLHKEFR